MSVSYTIETSYCWIPLQGEYAANITLTINTAPNEPVPGSPLVPHKPIPSEFLSSQAVLGEPMKSDWGTRDSEGNRDRSTALFSASLPELQVEAEEFADGIREQLAAIVKENRANDAACRGLLTISTVLID